MDDIAHKSPMDLIRAIAIGLDADPKAAGTLYDEEGKPHVLFDKDIVAHVMALSRRKEDVDVIARADNMGVQCSREAGGKIKIRVNAGKGETTILAGEELVISFDRQQVNLVKRKKA